MLNRGGADHRKHKPAYILLKLKYFLFQTKIHRMFGSRLFCCITRILLDLPKCINSEIFIKLNKYVLFITHSTISRKLCKIWGRDKWNMPIINWKCWRCQFTVIFISNTLNESNTFISIQYSKFIFPISASKLVDIKEVFSPILIALKLYLKVTFCTFVMTMQLLFNLNAFLNSGI